MKSSLLNRFAGLCLALTLTAGVEVSGNNPDGKGRNNALQESCINSISGLSEYQKERITVMEIQNQTVVNELREKQHAASGKTQKEELKKQVDKQAENHGNAIKTLLSADQQKQFIQFQSQGSKPDSQGQKQGAGKGKGNGSGSGRGNGSKCRM
jgi:hypothetical protein